MWVERTTLPQEGEGRLAARGRPAVSRPARRSIEPEKRIAAHSQPMHRTLYVRARQQALDERAIIGKARRLQAAHLALIVPAPDAHGILVKGSVSN